MANLPITQLPELSSSAVQPDDLLLAIDLHDYSYPNGTSKKLKIGELANYLNTSISSLENIVSQSNHGFSIGSVLRVDLTSSLYVTSSANTTTGEQSEVIGIVENIIDQNTFTLIYDGIYTLTSGSYPSWAAGGFVPGTVYFLNDTGSLINTDPSEILNTTWVSKPVLYAITSTQGLIDKQRGFYRPGYKEQSYSKIYVTGSNSFLLGDVLRKTKDFETASFGNWTLASADTYDSSRVVGVVTEVSPNYFGLTVSGLVHNLNYLSNGQTYYLVPSASFTSSLYQRNVSATIPTSSVIYPVYIATSTHTGILEKSQITINSSLFYNNKPFTYGPFPYLSQITPDTGSIITMITSILPNARVNETANVYWQYNSFNTNQLSPLQTTTWTLTNTTNGWTILQ